MDVMTDQPGVQFYTGNFLDGVKGKAGARYQQHHSLALETQVYPDAINQVSVPNHVLGFLLFINPLYF
jgi:aldose 1-epimerase